MDDTSEITYQLRAIVRAVLSPAVWFMVALETLPAVLLFFSPKSAEAAQPGLALATLVLFILIIYLIAGTYRTLALSQERISIAEIWGHAGAVFTDYLWLMIKAGLLFSFMLLILINALVGNLDQDTQTIGPRITPILTLVLPLLVTLLIYWLPVVFVSLDFRLIPTLQLALRLAWQRIAQLPFPAALILIPALLLWFLSAEMTLLLQLLIGLLGNLTGWIAVVYCMEYVQRHKAELLDPQSPG